MEESFSTEQHLRFAVFKKRIEAMDLEESQAELVRLYEDMLRKDVEYRELVKRRWGL